MAIERSRGRSRRRPGRWTPGLDWLEGRSLLSQAGAPLVLPASLVSGRAAEVSNAPDAPRLLNARDGAPAFAIATVGGPGMFWGSSSRPVAVRGLDAFASPGREGGDPTGASPWASFARPPEVRPLLAPVEAVAVAVHASLIGRAVTGDEAARADPSAAIGEARAPGPFAINLVFPAGGDRRDRGPSPAGMPPSSFGRTEPPGGVAAFGVDPAAPRVGAAPIVWTAAVTTATTQPSTLPVAERGRAVPVASSGVEAASIDPGPARDATAGAPWSTFREPSAHHAAPGDGATVDPRAPAVAPERAVAVKARQLSGEEDASAAFLPIGAELIAEFAPFAGEFDLGAGFVQLLDGIEDLGLPVESPAGDLPAIYPVAVAAVALEAARRWRNRQSEPGRRRFSPSRSSSRYRFS